MSEFTAEQLANYKVDRTNWEPGPWDQEPDRVQWQHAGYACLMTRHPHHGNWCGYVGVDEASPFFAKKWGGDDFPALDHEVNYSDFCDGHICHVPEAGMTDRVWWLGFDCGHAFDYCPGMHAMLPEAVRARFRREDAEFDLLRKRHYWTEKEVHKRVEKLADELRSLAP